MEERVDRAEALRLGYSQVVITPSEPAGHVLAGYVRRKSRSTGVHDDIKAGVLTLEGGEAAALVTLDLLGVDEKLYSELYRLAERILGRALLMVAGSHTHSAPASAFTSPLLTFGEEAFREEYFSELLAAVEQGLLQATEASSPASLAVAEAPVKGVATDRVNPSGKIDDTATLIIFRKPSGERCALLHFAVHPTVLGPDNLLISRDLVGYAVDEIARQLGLDTCFFANGAAANVSTRFTRRAQSFEEAERLGKLLARQVVSAAGTLSWVSCSSLHARSAACEVRLVNPREKLEEALSSRSMEGAHGRVRESVVEGFELLEKLAGAGNLPRAGEARVVGLRLGDNLDLVFLPFEIPSDFALELKRSRGRRRLVVSYANGYYGYLAPRGAQGYESLFELTRPEDKERIFETVRKLLGSDADPGVCSA
ncbi:MAG: neutral/alkaline non-lysosomal ceramidase N-terminal domain-containing protein [Thermofilum sp.]